jgi:hypothetical protein
MITPTKENRLKLVFKKYDDAIAALVDAATSQNVSRGPYSDEVYGAARDVAKRYRDIMNSLSAMEEDEH